MKTELDARYLLCPMPVIKTQDAIARLSDGDELTVRCTDPGALYDIPAWCKIHGHRLLDTQRMETELTFRVGICKP